MGFIKMKSVILLFLLNICTHTNLYASERTYVYCVNSNNKWKWLVGDDNKYVQVNGSWGEWRQYLNGEYVYFSFFIPENALGKVIELSNKCKKVFGYDYNIPQPANYISSSWNVFAINENTFVGGVIEFNFYPGFNSIPNMYLDIYRITEPDKLLLIKSDYVKSIFR